jgi:two-component sensor histidine kinase
MAGHIVNTTVLAVALAGSVRPAQLIIWCVYSYLIALLLLYRRLKNRGRSPRSVQRAAKKAAVYAFFLALPWSSAAVLLLSTLSGNEERILVALAVGMAASGTVLLSAVPRAALIYMSAILIPFALKCAILNQKSYLLLGVLAVSCWGFLASLIAKIAKGNQERQRTEQALTERNLQLGLAGEAALVGSYAYDTNTEVMQVSEGYAAIYSFPEGTTEMPRSQWQARVHPADVGRIEGLRSQVFGKRQGEYKVEYRIVLPDRGVRWIESRSFISYNSDGQPQRVVGVNIDVTERKRVEEQQRVLHAELDHRVKNVLATVSAIITQTPKADGSLADFVKLDDRIRSLGRTHELLSLSRWHGVSLEEIVRCELAPYTVANTEIGGPRVTLKAEAAQAVAMVLHELATNAAKYGVFSERGGRLLLRWRWLHNGSHGRVGIEWQELGGPTVRVPSQSGYGTSIVRELIPFELGGTVDLDFASDGLRCQLEIPADWVS